MDRDNYKSGEVTLADEFSDKIQGCIKNIIKKLGYVTHSIETKKISTGGNNFLGELYEINVRGKINDVEEETNIFLKHIIHNDDFKVYSIPEVYAKEAFIYTELGKIFQELQEEANIPSEGRFRMVESYDETNLEAIILANLTKEGFKTMYRLDVMTTEFAKLSVEQLARFHGLSFVLQKKRPEYFEEKIKIIKQSFVYDDYWNEFVRNMYKMSISNLNVEMKEKINKFFDISLEKYPKYMNGTGMPFKTLCHGDYKMNNILMKETNGIVTEAIPIDYQQIYYGCPIIDLIYFLYAASDRDFRKQHLFHLKDLYYESLLKFLNFFNIDVNELCTKDDFDMCFKKSLDYALMYTLYMLPMFFVSEEVPDLSKDELLDMTIKVDDSFYVRMQGIIDDFVELGVI